MVAGYLKELVKEDINSVITMTLDNFKSTLNRHSLQVFTELVDYCIGHLTIDD